MAFSAGHGVKSSSTCWTCREKYVQRLDCQFIYILHLYCEVLHDGGQKKCVES